MPRIATAKVIPFLELTNFLAEKLNFFHFFAVFLPFFAVGRLEHCIIVSLKKCDKIMPLDRN